MGEGSLVLIFFILFIYFFFFLGGGVLFSQLYFRVFL